MNNKKILLESFIALVISVLMGLMLTTAFIVVRSQLSLIIASSMTLASFLYLHLINNFSLLKTHKKLDMINRKLDDIEKTLIELEGIQQ